MEDRTMNGAESLVHTLLANDVDVCFANPGTSEMHFVSALDRIPGMRCVLGLFEGVATGAADGYYRMADKPAATLLHLGPGLANGMANLHNAGKAGSGVVNIVGDHATHHRALNAPLTSDIEALARTVSGWVRTSASPALLAGDGAQAIAAARRSPGQIATLILPADAAWGTTQAVPVSAGDHPAQPVPDETLLAAVHALRKGGRCALLLGGQAVREEALATAGRIAAATGCALLSEYNLARLQRGAGRVRTLRIPYAVDAAVAMLREFDTLVLVGAAAPVAFFAYPGKPGRLPRPDCRILQLAGREHDAPDALARLASALGADRLAPALVAAAADPGRPTGRLTAEGIARVLAASLPADAIVVDESVSTGRGFDAHTAGAAPHDWLNIVGGAIGFGLPAAIGAAVASPGRKVIALEGDGSAAYTMQSLWTMARESLDIKILVFANRSYQILRGELAGVGAADPGARATDMLTIDRPTMDWAGLARSMGVEAQRVTDLEALALQLRRAIAAEGPYLVEVVL